MSQTMKVYTCTNFEGHYPVGSAAVIVAPNRVVAKLLLSTELKRNKLPGCVKVDDIIELDITEASVNILNDGDY